MEELQEKAAEAEERAGEAESKLEECRKVVNAPVPHTSSSSGEHCNLAIFKSNRFPDKGIAHVHYHGKIRTIHGGDDPKAFWFNLRPCYETSLVDTCGTDHCASLEAHTMPGSFLRLDKVRTSFLRSTFVPCQDSSILTLPSLTDLQSFDVQLSPWQDKEHFRLDSSFCLRAALSGYGVSLESVHNQNLFLSSPGDLSLKIMEIGSSDDEKSMASFDIEYIPCNSRRLRGTGDGGVVVSKNPVSS